VKVVIVGAGEIGAELAHDLAGQGGNELVLIERNKARCEELAGDLDALVLHGDGTDPKVLNDAKAGEADALVATTDSDALNTVIAMLGHRLGIAKILVKLNDVGLGAACRELGVTDIISPKIVAAARLMASLYGLQRLDFSVVARGGLTLVELDAGRAAGRRLKELHLPDGTLVVLLHRGPEVLLPRPDTRLEEGDVLLLLAERAADVAKARAALEGK